jgi:hypothetical protein
MEPLATNSISRLIMSTYLVQKKRAEAGVAVPVGNNNNNKKRKVDNNNNNNNNVNVRKSGKKKATTKQTNTGRTRSVADMFAATFAPEPAFLEAAKAMGNQDVIDIEDVEVIDIEESGDQSNPNLTDPSLIVQLPGNVNDGSIPNASRTTAADFQATVTTILDEAARINGTEGKTG